MGGMLPSGHKPIWLTNKSTYADVAKQKTGRKKCFGINICADKSRPGAIF
jgi:hypothetical protein